MKIGDKVKYKISNKEGILIGLPDYLDDDYTIEFAESTLYCVELDDFFLI
tara:strand:+ start:292 stop:441 length:150 start_codon:yes stop_codon:yes gene_type:complete